MNFGDPVYTLSGKAVNLIAEIAAALERYKIAMEGPEGVRLRKLNHIRTLRGTTAIEGNTLTEDEITAILAGKCVAGSKREIDEVRGAHAAYAAVEKMNPLFYAAPIENIVFSHQRQYYRVLHAAQTTGDASVFVEFMLTMILRTIKARGVPKGGKKKVVSKGGKKTAVRILELARENPRITFAQMVESLGVSRSAIQKHVMHLKDAQLLRRVGPDKGGRWEVVKR